jgi:hypothetical protein
MPKKHPPDFGTATPTFGPAVNLPRILSAERMRGDGTGQTQKYGNRKVSADGYRFDSKKEAARYYVLKTMRGNGMIRSLEPHPEFDLLGRDGSVVYHYTADFAYSVLSQGVWVRVVEDCKSVATRKKDTWRVVKKLFRATFGYEITEV